DTNGDGNGTSPQQGDWKAIRFQATSDDGFCLLDSCVVKFGGSNYDVSLGAVTFVDASGTISNILVSDSYNYGVRCDGGSNPLVTGVELRNCRLDPLAMSLKSNPIFTDITFTSNGSKGIRIVEGTLSSNATLSKRDVAGITNIAYIVENLIISSNAVLTIDPGVIIKFPITFANQAGITVDGAMKAGGTTTQKIIFTSLRDDSNGGDTNNDGNNSTPTRGDWWTIEFYNSGSDSLNSLKNCEIRYGGSGGFNYYFFNPKGAGAVRVFDAQLRIDSCIVQQSANSGLGIYGSASPIVSNVQIYNISDAPVMMSLFANPTFTNISALNVGIMALGIVPETYSVSATVPKRDFAGLSNITYFFYTGYFSERPTINSGTTITIPSGVVFKANAGFLGILVNGSLVVEGTSPQKVVFTDVRDDSYGNPGDTNGDGSSTDPDISRNNRGWIELSDVSDDSVSSINHAIFLYKEYGIDLLQASPKISNCIFDKTDWGVRLNGVSQPTLDSCTFNNLTYAPIRTSLVSYPRSSEGNNIAGTTYRAIGVLEETLVQDVTLPRRSFAGVNNIPYLFGDYTIGTSAVLTISPGVVMKFFSDKRMIIRKGLIAEGGSTRDSLIVFTDLRDDFYGGDTNADSTATAPDPSSYAGIHWLGIDFDDESLDPLCRLRHAVVRFAGTPWTNQYGGIITNNASPTITYSLISKNRFGIIANGASNPVINYCDIYDNSEFGIQNVNESFVIDARWNWWGNNSGPMHSSNVGGTGNKISDGINYTPFLTNGATNPILGDVSLNGAVQAFDASLILKYVVNPTGPDSLNSIQRQVADVSGNGAIMAYDASLILQYVVGLIPRFPAGATPSDPDATVLQRVLALHKTSSAVLKVGSGSGRHGERLSIPLEVEQMTGVVSLQAGLNFDSRLMKIVDVESGGVASGKTFVWARDNQSGELRIALASSSLLTSGGTFARIIFEIADDARGT
ncbi:MAG: right-handed parallel beta-helix repeat-containing protein, partial [Ignavibacteriales bacterium]|nr:right-handed parallel beta-helix repeat-containing protein [Ignavibacteriales bacterium]